MKGIDGVLLGTELSLAEMTQNVNLAIESCRAVNVEVEDLHVSHVIEVARYPNEAINFLWRLISAQVSIYLVPG